MGIETLDFWVEAQALSKYYADKLRYVGLNNFELAMYAQLCSMLEVYFRINKNALEKSNEKDESGTDTGTPTA